MNNKLKLGIFILLPLLGLAAGYLLLGRTVQIVVDGKPQEVFTHALTVRGALRSAGYAVNELDRVNPAADSWLSAVEGIELDRPRNVTIWIDSSEEARQVNTAALTAEEILISAGMQPSVDDEFKVNGKAVLMDEPIDQRGAITLQYRPAVPVDVIRDGEVIPIRTTAGSVGQALWNEGIRLRGGDDVSLPYTSRVQDSPQLVIKTSRPVEITMDGKTFTIYTAAETVVEALAGAGINLQNLDFSQPGERKPIPEDGKISIIRVREEVILEQSAIPYETERIADANLEMNQQEVVQEGRSGIKASRVRVRYEDGKEVSRTSESDLILIPATNRIVRYGSKIVDNALNTPDGPISYYMTATVTATSYSPCRSGVPGQCYSGTSLGLPVQKGVIGVHRSWYNIFKGTRIYVPGYGVGTIADVGYYPYDNNWIDLGYSDADFVSWGAVKVTIYFLSPAPAGFTGVLP